MSTILLALASALIYGLGTVLQQRGTLQTRAGEGDPRFLVQMLRKPAWLLGILMQIIGILLQAAALKTGSLVVVQSLVALSLVFALPFGVRLTNQYIGRRTLLGAASTIMGIMAFVVIGQPQSTLDESPILTILVTGFVVIVLMVFLAIQGRRYRGAATAAFFSTAAGLSFALGAAVLKGLTMLTGEDISLPFLIPTAIVLIISALGGVVLSQSALKTGYLAPAMAGSNATTLIGSVLLGFIVFQESIISEIHLVALAMVGLALATFGVVLLAHPEARPELSSLPHA
jgi:drug/metabolite transporter (DMT)-like permease